MRLCTCSVKNKSKNYLTDYISNLTYPNLNSTKPCKTQPRIRLCTGRFHVIKVREGMRRTICAVYNERWEDRLYYRKNNGITQFDYEHVSQRCGEPKSTSISKSTPTPWTDAGVAFVFGVQCIISVKDSEGSILVSAHASTLYAVGRIKSKTKQDLTDS
jgi:hypothetical protein